MYILTKNQKLKEKLSKLIELITNNDGYISPDIKIDCKDGNLSIHSTSKNFNIKKNMEVPTKLFPRLDEYDFSIKKDKLICKTTKQQSDPLQKDIMFLMIDIFNLTSKISFHKSSNVFYNLENHREFLTLLLSPLHNAKINNYLKLLDEEKDERLLIDTFFNTRVFNLKDKNKVRYALLPLIDYLNHKVLSKGFQQAENSIYVENAPSKESNELFVSYNYYDALETLTYYGFVDTSSPLYFSIPIKIVLNETITIEIKNIGFKKVENEKVPQGLEHIKEIIPHIEKVNKNHVIVSKLLIPNRQLPLALRKFLHLILNELGVEQNQELRLALIQAIEKELISQNTSHYKKLESMLNNVTKDDNYMSKQLEVLINHNLTHIKTYGSWF